MKRRLGPIALTMMAALSTVGCGEIGSDFDAYATQELTSCGPRPLPYCTADGDLVTYSSLFGTCRYIRFTTNCPFGCSNRRCIDPCETEECLLNPHKGYPYTFKGQLHAHSTQSNRVFSPDNLPDSVPPGLLDLLGVGCDPLSKVECEEDNQCALWSGIEDSTCKSNGEKKYCTKMLSDDMCLRTSLIEGQDDDLLNELYKYSERYCDLHWDHCPDSVLGWYRDAGYAFVSLTDHDFVTPREQIDGLLHIPGAEDGWWFNHHMTAVGLSNPPYPPVIGVDENGNGLYDKSTRECSENQNRINYTNSLGALAILAHPKARSPAESYPAVEALLHHADHVDSLDLPNPWCFHPTMHYSLEEIVRLRGHAGMEVYSPHDSPPETDATDWWDIVLNNGPSARIWGLATDDFENGHNHVFNRGWIMVNSLVAWGNGAGGGSSGPIPTALEGSILSNIRQGNFFAVGREFLDLPPSRYPTNSYSGPSVRISTRGRNIDVSVQGGDSGNYAGPLAIRFIANTALAKTVSATSPLTKTLSGSYTLSSTDTYVRVEVDEVLWVRVDGSSGSFKLRYRTYSQPIYAKYSTGRVTGVAWDRQGRVMPNALLIFKKSNTNDMSQKTAITNDDGSYTVELTNGYYSVTSLNCLYGVSATTASIQVAAGKQRIELHLDNPGTTCCSLGGC